MFAEGHKCSLFNTYLQLFQLFYLFQGCYIQINQQLLGAVAVIGPLCRRQGPAAPTVDSVELRIESPMRVIAFRARIWAMWGAKGSAELWDSNVWPNFMGKKHDKL